MDDDKEIFDLLDSLGDPREHLDGGLVSFVSTEDGPFQEKIIPLSADLPSVPEFDYQLLPDDVRPWVQDIVERVQCPAEFVAVAVITGLASLIGRKAAIHPKQFDDWIVVPNLWGALIGRPSTMKSPALSEAERPLKRLSITAQKEYETAISEHAFDLKVYETEVSANEKEIKSAVKSKDPLKIDAARENYLSIEDSEPKRPSLRRYIVNDATVEKLGELLNENPNGLLLARDELIGWLKSLDREDRSNDRSFYLECFSGSNSYTYDRIGRGTIHIESTTLSIIGGVQPSKLRPYVFGAINQGADDDGLIQRFQLAVWPDDNRTWRNVDRWPSTESKNLAYQVYERLSELPDAEQDDEGRVQAVRFTSEAQAIFNKWIEENTAKIKAPDIHPAIESHLAKYPSLMPSLALVINEVEVGHMQPVNEQSALKAAAWCELLEAHMHRIYGGAHNPSVQNAITILERRGKLPARFTSRDIHRKGWTGLSEASHVNDALRELIETGHIMQVKKDDDSKGGRPSVSYEWNPDLSRH